MNADSKTQIAIVMGSSSDWEVMQHAATMLSELGLSYNARVVSAHRTPELLYEFAKGASAQGLRCIIAGAGGAAHLPGMIASLTTVPVLGVPVPSKHMQGMDSLLSIVQMPKGVPVATFAIGAAGAANAALFAAAMLGCSKLENFRAAQRDAVLQAKLPEPE
ncbi:MAG TPA: 5-(carboxyamino)imidazole ribonucleotide mutase [Burkholderiales bacterium]|jgi:5-(carboxyamino)imidazole ribonucleotide mutase|nr:5-(carboxyamino)imidazole ribonucleotide mutase [Burkholderiales bacterium]